MNDNQLIEALGGCNAVHGDIRHLEKNQKGNCGEVNVHGDIRHLET